MKKRQKKIGLLAAVATVVASIAQADIVIQPTAATAVENNASAGATIDGADMSDASIIETGDPVPATWPTSTGADNNAARWRGSWAGDSSQTGTGNYATYTLGGTYDVKGLYWWGSQKSNARGTEVVTIAVSTDGENYADVLVDYDVMDAAATPEVAAGEYINFGANYTGVTHVRVDNVQYLGYKGTIQEIRIVAGPLAPAPPVWSEPVTGVTGIEGMDYSDTLEGKATDPNQDPLTFAKTGGEDWLNVATNGVLSGIPNVLGTNTFTVTADDGNGNGSPVATTLTIFVRATLPPEWTEPITSGNARVDVSYNGTLDGKATDPDGGTITYSLTDVGTWLNVETNGVLSGTPTSGDEGSNTFTVVADDGVDTPTSTTLTIFVAAPLPIVGRNISINFTHTTNEVFVGGELIGPLETDSSNWNVTAGEGPNVTSGSSSNLLNHAGAATTLDLNWTARGTWYNRVDDASIDDENKLAVGYLDDNWNVPTTATMTEIPYENYRLYVLISSDQAQNNPAGYDASNALVTDGSNGGVWAFGGNDQTTRTCFSSVRITKTVTGWPWSESTDTALGNYWIMDNLSGSTLSISIGGNNTPGRASIAGIIIEEIGGTASPVSDLVIAGPFAGGMELSWTSENGMPYGVQTNDNLIITDGWATWLTGITGDGGTLTVTNTTGPNQTFYRVISE